MPLDVQQQFAALKRPSIKKIKQEIIERALERQQKIERGECDVPIRYVPLPVATLYDLLSRLEYRADSLSLAIPPAKTGLGQRFKRLLKKWVCTALRWLLIRQVEFNVIALEHAREISQQLAAADRNLAEFMASVGALKLRVNALDERLCKLDRQESSGFTEPVDVVQPWLNEPLLYQALGRLAKGLGPILVAELGQVDLLKFFVAEGVEVRGIESDASVTEAGLELDLPVEQADLLTYLQKCDDGQLGAVIFDAQAFSKKAPREFNDLLAQIWRKLGHRGRVLIGARNPQCRTARDRRAMPVELLTYVVESQCFSVVDVTFWRPLSREIAPLVQSSSGRSFDLRQYSCYLIAGAKE
jgi:hypothetical protein